MKKRRRVKRRLIVLLFMVGLTVILLFLLFAPIFNIKEIEVYGSTRYPAEVIRGTSGIIIGENGFRQLKLKPESILDLRLLDSEERIRNSLSYVKTCVVRLHLPDRVSIAITEREPAAYLVYFDNYLIVDEQGYVLEVQSEKPYGPLKEIRGIDFQKYAIGGQLEASDVSLIRTGVTIINTIIASDEHSNLKLFEVLDWVDMVDKNTAMMSLDKRVIVRFDPQDKLQYTIDFTKEIFFKKISSKETGRLEFSGNQYPSFIPDQNTGLGVVP
jgi:cell division protein FtsQ